MARLERRLRRSTAGARAGTPTGRSAWCAARSGLRRRRQRPPPRCAVPALEPRVAAPVPPTGPGGLTMLRILVDPVACDAYGYCAELLPEAITLDEWGYPVVDGKPLPPELVDAAGGRPGTAHGAPSRCGSARAVTERHRGAIMDPWDDRCLRMNPEGLVIRRATEADLGRAVELLGLGALPGGPARGGPHRLRSLRAALREIEDAGGAVLVAELDGEVIGVCQLIVFRHLQASGGRARRSSRCTCIRTTGGTAWARRSCVTPSSEPAPSAATGCSSPRTLARGRAPLLRAPGFLAHARGLQDAPGVTSPAAPTRTTREPALRAERVAGDGSLREPAVGGGMDQRRHGGQDREREGAPVTPEGQESSCDPA